MNWDDDKGWRPDRRAVGFPLVRDVGRRASTFAPNELSAGECCLDQGAYDLVVLAALA